LGWLRPERQKSRSNNELADKKPAAHLLPQWYSVSEDALPYFMPHIRLGRNWVAGAADAYWSLFDDLR
jgi:hypothetical protein